MSYIPKHNNIAAPFNPSRYSPDTVYTLDSGWSDWYTNGTISHDATVVKEGAASLKIVTDGAGSNCGARNNITDVDWSAKTFSIWLRCSDWSSVNEAALLVSTSGTFTAFYICDFKGKLVSPADDEWFQVTFTRRDFQVGTGSPSWSTVNDLILRVSDTSTAVDFYFDALEVYDEPAGTDKGVVCFVADDGDDSQYAEMYQYLQKYGYRATYFVIPDLLGETGYLTQAEVDDMHDSGNEISGHGQTNLTTLTGEPLRSEIQKIKNYYTERGYKGSELFAYPNGGNNEEVRRELQKYFSIGRTIDNFGNNPFTTNRMRLNARTISQATSTSSITGSIDDAISNNEIIIIVWHVIVASGATADTEYNRADFRTVIDHCSTNGYRVLPLGEALRMYHLIGQAGSGSGDALTTNGLDQFAATTSAELAGVISDETGSGALVFGTSPTLVTPALGTPASGVLTNTTGYPGDSSLTTVGTVTTGNVDAVVSSASTTTAGKIEVATTAEVDTGTDTGRAVSPDALAGSYAGTKVVQITCFDYTTDVATGDGAGYFHIPASLNGMNLATVHAEVITAGTTGTTDIQIHNVTGAVDVLSTKLTIDSAETGSDTAATAAVINTANDDADTNDLWRIDVDAVSTTAPKGLIVTLEFRLP